MNGSAAYTVFFAYGIVWVALGTIAVIALLKSENHPIRFGKWGLLVLLTTLIPMVAALGIGAIMAQTNFSFVR